MPHPREAFFKLTGFGVMVEPDGGQDRFLIKGVSPEMLRRFRSGLLDLRELLVGEGDVDWFLAVAPGGFAENFSLSPRSDSLEDSGFLPEPGFVLHGEAGGDRRGSEHRP